MGDGTVKSPYYKTNGEYVWRGLRNKRKAYWARQRQIELMEKLRRQEAKEERDNQFRDEWQ